MPQSLPAHAASPVASPHLRSVNHMFQSKRGRSEKLGPSRREETPFQRPAECLTSTSGTSQTRLHVQPPLQGAGQAGGSFALQRASEDGPHPWETCRAAGTVPSATSIKNVPLASSSSSGLTCRLPACQTQPRRGAGHAALAPTLKPVLLPVRLSSHLSAEPRSMPTLRGAGWAFLYCLCSVTPVPTAPIPALLRFPPAQDDTRGFAALLLLLFTGVCSVRWIFTSASDAVFHVIVTRLFLQWRFNAALSLPAISAERGGGKEPYPTRTHVCPFAVCAARSPLCR